MSQRNACQLAAGLALAVLLVAGPAGLRGDDPKPPKKDEAKKDNPLQGLQDAFNKGVTLKDVDPKDLSREITDGAAKNAPGATIKKAQKQEIKHTLKYVALDKPKVQSYQATVIKDDKRSRVQIALDGKVMGSRPVADTKDEKKAKDKKEIEIPAKAAKAVKAIKELYPDAVVIEITTEVYQDPSGTVDILTYEIEFMLRGTKREMVASPDGIIPHLWKPIAEKDLPKAIADALTKAADGGKVEGVSQFEIRAGLQFAPIDEARVVYKLEMEKDGKTSNLNLRADGTPVPAGVRPGQNRAYLGLSFEKNTTTVSQVSKDGPAEKAGVKVGDKLLALGETKVASVADLLKALQAVKPGTEVKVQLNRSDEMVTVTVKLGTPPAQ